MTTSTSTVMDMVRVLCWIGNNITLEGYGVESRLNCFSIYTGNNQKFITRGTAKAKKISYAANVRLNLKIKNLPFRNKITCQ